MKRHFENLIARAARAVRHWWLLMLAGILAIVAGICVFAFPIESYVTLSILFGVLMLLTGAIQLIVASTSGNYLMMRGYIIVGGVLDVILGVFLCVYPGISLFLLFHDTLPLSALPTYSVSLFLNIFTLIQKTKTTQAAVSGNRC